ncbi:lytic transglycosylase domain-containing protein, partial [Pseudomonas aeruginosa]
MYLPSLKHSLPLLAALVLAACSSTNTPPAGKAETADLSASVPTRPAEPEEKTLEDYGGYPSALDAVKQKNDAAVAAYLENASDSAMAENVRNEWLKSLGARKQWT